MFVLEITDPAAPPKKGKAMAAAGFRYSDISLNNQTHHYFVVSIHYMYLSLAFGRFFSLK